MLLVCGYYENYFHSFNSYANKYLLAGYQILNAIAFFMKSSLVEQTPEMAPIYTVDGSTVQNPAVGYPHSISSPICDGKPQGPHKAACPDSHGTDSITTLDYE